MFKKRLVLVLVLLLALSPVFSRPVAASGETDIVKKILAYYCYHQEAAKTDITRLLEQLEEINPESARAWEEILETWRWAAEDMEGNLDVLPDGLPQDDSLCILVMGFQLTYGGNMEPELLQRLEVALASAEKYPNAYILCTGGGTAPYNPYVTEAGQMAQWLKEQGIAPERIIVENRSVSTEENVLYSYEILSQDYPQIRSLALISSDYHLRRCYLLFQAGILLPEPDLPYTIVSNACFDAGYDGKQEGYLKETANLGVLLDIYTMDLPKPTLSVLTGIQVSGVTQYTAGDTLQLTVMADYNCSYSRDITSQVEISGFDANQTGEQMLTVTYTENNVTMTGTISITVSPLPTTQPTTEAPTSQPETTAPTTPPAETAPPTEEPSPEPEESPVLLLTLAAAALGIGLLALICRPRRGKYEKRRKA